MSTPILRGRLLAMAASVLALAACTSGPPPPADTRPYEQQIQTYRAEKDTAFRSSADSPIPAEARASFSGLLYFAIDPAFRVPAFLTQSQSNPPIMFDIRMSSNTTEKMRKVGTLGFSLNGTALTLTAFAEESTKDMKRLFVPFTDLTSGAETYKHGRYLDLDRTPTGLYDLDFNKSYHPSCVYNPQYECPVPPKENTLPVAVRAGERLK